MNALNLVRAESAVPPGVAIESPCSTRRDEEWLTPLRFAGLLGLLVAASFPAVLLGQATFVFRDFGCFSYPIAFFHRESFWRGELPLWNPYSYCGIPFLAQWNTLVLYPPTLIYLLLPLTWSLPFFCLAHLYWGGLGMYFLAHRWTGHRLAAGLAGVIFSFNGMTLNSLMWPSQVATFGWVPWVLWLVPEGWRAGGSRLLWGVLAGSLQMLAGGPETILLTWVILLLLAGGEWIRGEADRRKVALRFAGMAGLVAALCAPQLLPFLQLVSHSQRNSGFGSFVDWSMPVWGFANFLVPLFRSFPSQGVPVQYGQCWTSSFYAGIGTWLLVAVVYRGVRDWRVTALGALALMSLVLSWGDGGLVYHGLRAWFPALGFIRYPIKFALGIIVVVPILAAFGVRALASRSYKLGRFEWGCGLVLLVVISALVGLDRKWPIASGIGEQTLGNGITRAVALVLVLVVLAVLGRSSSRGRVITGALFLLVFWFDLITQVPAQNPLVPLSVYSPGWAKAQIKWQPAPKLGESRVMLAPEADRTLGGHQLPDPRESYLVSRLAFQANCNLLDNIPQTLGFFAVTPLEGNNAAVLPMLQTNCNCEPLLDLMGVKWTTAPGTLFDWQPRATALPLVTCGQSPVFLDDERAFQSLTQSNTDFRHTVLLPLEAKGKVRAGSQPDARITASEFSHRNVVIKTEAPAPTVVVIAQTYYPAWKAYIDGQPAKLWRADYAFQGIEVPAGKHDIRLRYQDGMFWEGAVVSVLGFLACTWVWRRSSDRQQAAEPLEAQEDPSPT
jgi:hypothetical protein